MEELTLITQEILSEIYNALQETNYSRNKNTLYQRTQEGFILDNESSSFQYHVVNKESPFNSLSLTLSSSENEIHLLTQKFYPSLYATYILSDIKQKEQSSEVNFQNPLFYQNKYINSNLVDPSIYIAHFGKITNEFRRISKEADIRGYVIKQLCGL